MKAKWMFCVPAVSLLAQAQVPAYNVIDLGALPGGNPSFGYYLNDNRQMGGSAGLASGTQQAMTWEGPFRINLGTPGLNSTVYGINAGGQIAISSEVSAKDPNKENFCAWGTALACGVFLSQRGVVTQLPTLGGINATGGNINVKGEIIGAAENSTRDTTCPGGTSFSGTGPQLYGFEAVVWGPAAGAIRTLAPLTGDTVGMALSINDNSQAVGATGTCTTTELPPLAFGQHAVMWDATGTPHDLGNLGSKALNMALQINNQGQVVGVSAINDQANPMQGHHAFLWNASSGMQDLGLLPGDASSVGCAINDAGDVVGLSLDDKGNPRGFFWHAGAIYDMNALAANSPLYILSPEGINARGEVVGYGATQNGEVHAFLAVPSGGATASSVATAESGTGGKVTLTEEVKKSVRERLPVGWRGGPGRNQ